MAKYRGFVRKSDLEGGFYQLVTDDGTVYEIEGGGPELRSDGARVEVEGRIDKAAVSFTMTGPRLKVTSAKLT